MVDSKRIRPPVRQAATVRQTASATGIQLPVAAYNPPQVAPLPPPPPVADGGVIDGRAETSGAVYALPPSVEIQVGTTSKPWRAIDVYVTNPEGSGGGFAVTDQLTIVVYALVRGQRVLVGVGRYRSANGLMPVAPIRVCAVRAPIAERFEVSAHWNGAAAHSFQIAYIAADQSEARDDIAAGAVPYRGLTAERDFVDVDFFKGIELLQLTATNTGGAVGFVQIHELAANLTIPAAQVPVWSSAVPASTSLSWNAEDLAVIQNASINMGGNRRFRGLGIAFSSQAQLFNAAGVTGFVSCLVR